MAKVLAGHLAARALREAGIPWVAGVAGESFLPLLDGLRLEGIPYLTVAHESGAAFMASAHSRVTGRAAVVAVTRGPGASNAMIGIHEAAQAGAPVVLIVGQIESDVRGRRALQEMEFDRVFGSVAKGVFVVTRADTLAPSVLAAIRKAELGRPGPVVVSVPADIFYKELASSASETLASRPRQIPGALTEDALAELAGLMGRAERGLLVVGRSFSGGAHADALERFASATGFGVLGGHAFPDVMRTEHPQWLGCSTIRGPSSMKRTLQEADVIVLLDHRLGDRVTQGYLPLDAALAVITDEIDVGWDEYLGARFYLAGPAGALAQLARALPRPERAGTRVTWVGTRRQASLREADAVLEASAAGDAEDAVAYAHVLTAVDRALPAESTIVSDAGSFNDWFLRYLPFRPGRRYLGPLSGSMGFGVPGALGAQLARPSARTLALVGDGGFLMTGMEVSTAVHLGLPVTFVVFRNRVWGSIALHQDKRFTGHRFGVELPDVSYAALARALGAAARSVRRTEDLEPSLREAFAARGPVLVEVFTDGARPSPSSFEAQQVI